ncbi:MAG: YitT family protein [Bacteroidales bacterium]
MAFLTQEKLFSWHWFKSLFLILIGTFIMAVAFVYFISPYKFAPGGTYGIAIIIHHLMDWPTGFVALSIDIPLLIIGLKILGPRFGWKTIVGIVALSQFVNLLMMLQGDEALIPYDPLLSSIFGGVILGGGLGIVLRARATTGGSDIIAMIISKYTKLPLGQLLISIDSVIALLGLVAFKQWEIPLYSLIVIFITGRVIDVVIEGISYNKSLLIISDKAEEISEKLMKDLKRGGTFLQAEGMYHGNKKKVIFTVLSRRELSIVKHYIVNIDPDAFLTVSDAKEILGKGFNSLQKSIEKENI